MIFREYYGRVCSLHRINEANQTKCALHQVEFPWTSSRQFDRAKTRLRGLSAVCALLKLYRRWCSWETRRQGGGALREAGFQSHGCIEHENQTIKALPNRPLPLHSGCDFSFAQGKEVLRHYFPRHKNGQVHRIVLTISL